MVQPTPFEEFQLSRRQLVRVDHEYDLAMYSHLNGFGDLFTPKTRRTGRIRGHSWEQIRRSIFARDEYTCQYCFISDVPLECDHILPIACGGMNDDENLTTACVPCNRSKQAKTLEAWRFFIALQS
jgi:HNH endonuclease